MGGLGLAGAPPGLLVVLLCWVVLLLLLLPSRFSPSLSSLLFSQLDEERHLAWLVGRARLDCLHLVGSAAAAAGSKGVSLTVACAHRDSSSSPAKDVCTKVHCSGTGPERKE